MALDTSTLLTSVASDLAAANTTTCLDEALLTSWAAATVDSNNQSFSVASISCIPEGDVQCTADGTTYFLEDAKRHVIKSGNKWYGLDGRAARCDYAVYEMYTLGLYTGDGTAIDRSSPVQEASLSNNWVISRKTFLPGHWNGYSTYAGIKDDGTLWEWGHNGYGQLGVNSTTVARYSSPVQEASSSTNWCALGGPYQVDPLTGGNAIKTDGTLWSWGGNNVGQLGTNSTVYYSSPVQEASSSTNWSISRTMSQRAAAGIKTDGTLWSWGQNSSGLSLTNNTVCYSSPVQEVTSSTNWCAIGGTNTMQILLKTDGTLWGGGNNINGGLGVVDLVNHSSPVQESSSSTNWCFAEEGRLNTHAIKTDGTMWVMGRNNCGQLGTNDVICYSSPVQEASSSTNWCWVGATNYGKTAVKTDGTLWVMGGGPGEAYYKWLGISVSTCCMSSPTQEATSATNWIAGGGSRGIKSA